MAISQDVLRAELRNFATSAIREELIMMRESLMKDLLTALPGACGYASEASPRVPPVLEPAGKHCTPNYRVSRLEMVAHGERPSFHPLAADDYREEAVLPVRRETSLYARVSKKKSKTRFGTIHNGAHRLHSVGQQQRSEAVSIPSDWVVPREESRGMKQRGWGSLQHMCQEFVASAAFEFGSVGVVLLNILWVGVQTDWVSRHWSHDTPKYFSLIDLAFAVLTVCELTTRIIAIGWSFFYDSNWKWNWLDLTICLFQVVDVAANSLAGGSDGAKNIKVIKLIRVARVARIAVAFPELHVLMSSIVDSMYSLLWVLLLIFAFLYAVAIVITQVVSDHKLKMGRDELHGDGMLLLTYFGTLDLTMVSLYQVISGGIEWGELSRPLEEQISPIFMYFFPIYVAFQLFAMLNVITANFVEHTNRRAVQVQAEGQVAALWDMLGHTPVEPGEEDPFTIDLTHFKQYRDHPTMIQFREAIQAEDMDCEDIFNLFDRDRDGVISPTELLQMSAELIGPAKATSLARLSRQIFDLMEFIESKLDENKSVVEKQHAETMERWPFRSQATADKIKKSSLPNFSPSED
eukprot:TRINITY_DN25142_c0_g1_i1.p1 TRINITY_DN25142_c0_g1~~TRINITY_DN25142_c0_g1_i1.p1  ORF type:complete len:578 (+),score=86.20 TRINITY_DN25142_c0_g1_i1:71-1804(+)